MSASVYSTTSCPYCTLVKNYLKEKKVPFQDFDVGRDQRRADEMVRKSGQMGVPVVEINGRIIIGFNKAEIDKALA
ncbi:MAG: NrdH-redoxin [Treponema sp. GWB1_62_6]|nr:MAG: NrdH-redoxin [Treponema sp. GWA1_62_8]OHE68457.1 MAG: NrdH-redoxin [Treponema sp. GWB1_62_6]OHE69126.1 MAG: NrdH-redoxin [Treponema sp. GWC1_61_84]OHE75414.1 MAG: NrdH-redoxin [Treponema sp. RIFOXYC1_FULL_61_9]HCM27074.1 NrdH-redoxin [Treponema sp.]